MSDSASIFSGGTARRARFPVIDAHNHLWGAWDNVDRAVRVMDEAGVLCYCDLTANVRIVWVDGGYRVAPGRFKDFVHHAADRYTGRFYGFTTATFTRPLTEPLFKDAGAFVDETLDILRADVRHGARGLKLLKEFGLHYRDGQGSLIACDDKRLFPVWTECARLGIPVLIHQADPIGFFQPPTPDNEHYETLKKYPSWRFHGPKYPSFEILQRNYRNLVRSHPATTFLLPHCANWPENLAYVAGLLDECPNAFIDCSARIDELGKRPDEARDFLIRYRDRVYFGTDMPASNGMYACYFRFLETDDRDIIPPDYDGAFGRYRWKMTGLDLPNGVLRAIYYENALRLIPGLARDLSGRIPEQPDNDHAT
ncbi:MAG: amidohydrolase family protein [Kiritimatiellia bacterium]